MIMQNEIWIDIIPSMGTPAVDGKWLYFGPTAELHSMVDRLNRLVEEGNLDAAKIARKLPNIDPFPDKPCVLCVFTSNDDTSKSHAKKLLKDEFGINVSTWKSDLQTFADWAPDGWLKIESEINKLRKQIKDKRFENEDKVRLKQLADSLLNGIEGIQTPSRLAEIELSKTKHSVDKLLHDLGPFGDASSGQILVRLDDIQKLLHNLIEKHQNEPNRADIYPLKEEPDRVFV